MSYCVREEGEGQVRGRYDAHYGGASRAADNYN
jgi:hypothetical protein